MNSHKKQSAIALKKAQTSIAKIIDMIDRGDYCIDILQQVLAVNGLIRSAADKLLQNHLETCFTVGMHSKQMSSRTKMIEEVVRVVRLSNKSK